MKDEVYENIAQLNAACYQEWKENKRKIEMNPLVVQNYQIVALVVVCALYIVSFYIFYNEDEQAENAYEITVFYAYIIFIFVISKCESMKLDLA